MCNNINPWRATFDDLISSAKCMELIAIQRALSVLGYRPGVRSTTLMDCVMSAPQLLIPLIEVRQAIWDKVEEMFGLSCELHVEFTGLISWTTGSSLGWHTDDNREYLSQRHYSSVLYLNGPLEASNDECNMADGFTGGDLCFKDDTPDGGEVVSRLTPRAGRLVAYSSDSHNMHQVEEVLSGERFTLTMWFTRVESCREDPKVIRLLQDVCLSPPRHPLPMSLPSTMYLDSNGSDIRVERLISRGLSLEASPSRASPAQFSDDSAICLCSILAYDIMNGDDTNAIESRIECPSDPGGKSLIKSSICYPIPEAEVPGIPPRGKKRRTENVNNTNEPSTMNITGSQENTNRTPVCKQCSLEDDMEHPPLQPPQDAMDRLQHEPRGPMSDDSEPVCVHLVADHGHGPTAWFANIGNANAILQLGLWRLSNVKYEPLRESSCRMCLMIQAARDHLRFLSERMRIMIISSVASGCLSTGS